jgi:hypothetical protein
MPYVLKEDQKRADILSEYLDALEKKKFRVRYSLRGIVKKVEPDLVTMDAIPSTPGNPSYRMYFCAVRSKKWNKYGRKCKDFELKLDLMTLPEYVSIYTAQKISRTQNKLIWIGIVVSMLGLFFVLFSSEIKDFLGRLFSCIF